MRGGEVVQVLSVVLSYTTITIFTYTHNYRIRQPKHVYTPISLTRSEICNVPGASLGVRGEVSLGFKRRYVYHYRIRQPERVYTPTESN